MRADRVMRLSDHFLNGDYKKWGVWREYPSTLPLEGARIRLLPGDPDSRRTEKELLRLKGIEDVLRNCVIPQVHHRFSQVELDYLMNLWQMKKTPDEGQLLSFDQSNGRGRSDSGHWYPFLVLERSESDSARVSWGAFAHLWFADIEPEFRWEWR
jgi:hypothetical protein